MTIKDLMIKRKNNNELKIVAPVVNIEERENEIVLYAEMPGIDKNDLQVEVHNDELMFSAKKINTVPKDYSVCLQERISVEYKRIFSLGNQINKDEVSARYDNGILMITLKKRERAQPKKITIN